MDFAGTVGIQMGGHKRSNYWFGFSKWGVKPILIMED